jgi:hypothetical protein
MWMRDRPQGKEAAERRNTSAAAASHTITDGLVLISTCSPSTTTTSTTTKITTMHRGSPSECGSLRNVERRRVGLWAYRHRPSAISDQRLSPRPRSHHESYCTRSASSMRRCQPNGNRIEQDQPNRHTNRERWSTV